ncbi:YcnI family protein [Gulosibacter sp. 10]|uniref:YcnI family copper-binding membrane protein n=1 Tax=Gulosibacter sp. 10 TaxID=1255570 RepID=UPI00097F0F39|nr:YcnI family protein [Gulosibacter sp. 10]SJM63976.1 Conserved membrane protein in copper uptake, YcnI [Gulosibacter sp. 10]
MRVPHAAAAVILSVVLLFAGATAGHAHVTVEASSTEAGSWAVLTFKVPTESDTASTTGLRVQLPVDAPLLSAQTQPVPGWEAEVVRSELPEPVTDDHGNTITEAPTEIIWTATGEGLAPSEFGEFKVSVGPLPESGTLHLPAVQVYSDGEEVDWVQQASAGTEADRPAPSIEITPATPDGDQDAAVDAAQPEEAGSQNFLGWASLAVAVLAVLLAGVALLRRPRVRDA